MKPRLQLLRFIAIVLAVALMTSGLAHATSTLYGFRRVSSNSPVNIELMLELLVSDVFDDDTMVSFRFRNLATPYPDTAIGQVYFDDLSTPLLTAPGVITTTGVGDYPNQSTVFFDYGASPGDLPSGGNLIPAFVTDMAFGALSPSAHHGLHPYGADPNDDTLTLTFAGRYSDVTTAMDIELFRVGLHVQGLPLNTDRSDAYVTIGREGDPLIPEPLTMTGVLMGLAGIGGYLRRARRKT